ncbi:Uncharacterized protein family UPF0016 [Kingella potus]|uniref:GDT1 family protein n=1 Tax=Kingella potus TaxID=265175 RepID=A0A377QZW8_9NEIS|nr:TMEM165/GDT1 family protein [Kingella potus]UOP00912.1 TMEM165/GDT1 family protein [Kingella potus]STR00567.1 Uncharacterized protein family UPF0016 [Kingella potus]
MDAFSASLLGVFVAEIGDKTQLLTLFLAARFANRNAVAAGILAATLLNHLFSAFFGVWLAAHVPPAAVKWAVGLSFVAVGLWLLLPDKDGGGGNARYLRYGAFAATAVLFFLAEIGDKTQIATVLLAARYHDWLWVTAGSTFGMMAANLPAAYWGGKILTKIPARAVRLAACLLFCLLGVLTLAGGGIAFG